MILTAEIISIELELRGYVRETMCQSRLLPYPSSSLAGLRVGYRHYRCWCELVGCSGCFGETFSFEMLHATCNRKLIAFESVRSLHRMVHKSISCKYK